MFTPIAFGCLLTGAAGIGVSVPLRNLWRAHRSKSGPTIDCTIVGAQVQVGHEGSRPEIVCRYQVAGKRYESGRVVVGGLWETSGDGPARLVERFPKGPSATVALDPAELHDGVPIPESGFIECSPLSSAWPYLSPACRCCGHSLAWPPHRDDPQTHPNARAIAPCRRRPFRRIRENRLEGKRPKQPTRHARQSPPTRLDT